MWMMTTRGFFSAVAKDPKEPTRLTIRGRRKRHLESLRELIPGDAPYTGVGTDYPWRIDCTVAEWAQALALMATEVNYSNFKNEITKRGQKKEHDAYARCWTALLSIEDTTGPDKGTTQWSTWSGGKPWSLAYDPVGMGLTMADVEEGGRIDNLIGSRVGWYACGDFVFDVDGKRWRFRFGLTEQERQDAVELMATTLDAIDAGVDEATITRAVEALRIDHVASSGHRSTGVKKTAAKKPTAPRPAAKKKSGAKGGAKKSAAKKTGTPRRRRSRKAGEQTQPRADQDRCICPPGGWRGACPEHGDVLGDIPIQPPTNGGAQLALSDAIADALATGEGSV